MSVEALLIFSVVCMLMLYLPSASSRFLVDYTIARGKLRAMVLVPAAVAGSFISFAAGLAIFLWLSGSLRSMSEALSWASLAYLAIYLMRAMRQSLRLRLADNDNLREKSLIAGMGRSFAGRVGPGLAVAIAALLVQVADSASPNQQLVLESAVGFGIAALSMPLVQVLIARRRARKMRLSRLKNSAAAKPRTRFIASRAVSAGYRRIAA